MIWRAFQSFVPLLFLLYLIFLFSTGDERRMRRTKREAKVFLPISTHFDFQDLANVANVPSNSETKLLDQKPRIVKIPFTDVVEMLKSGVGFVRSLASKMAFSEKGETSVDTILDSMNEQELRDGVIFLEGSKTRKKINMVEFRNDVMNEMTQFQSVPRKEVESEKFEIKKREKVISFSSLLDSLNHKLINHDQPKVDVTSIIPTNAQEAMMTNIAMKSMEEKELLGEKMMEMIIPTYFTKNIVIDKTDSENKRIFLKDSVDDKNKEASNYMETDDTFNDQVESGLRYGGKVLEVNRFISEIMEERPAEGEKIDIPPDNVFNDLVMNQMAIISPSRVTATTILLDGPVEMDDHDVELVEEKQTQLKSLFKPGSRYGDKVTGEKFNARIPEVQKKLYERRRPANFHIYGAGIQSSTLPPNLPSYLDADSDDSIISVAVQDLGLSRRKNIEVQNLYKHYQSGTKPLPSGHLAIQPVENLVSFKEMLQKVNLNFLPKESHTSASSVYQVGKVSFYGLTQKLKSKHSQITTLKEISAPQYPVVDYSVEDGKLEMKDEMMKAVIFERMNEHVRANAVTENIDTINQVAAENLVTNFQEPINPLPVLNRLEDLDVHLPLLSDKEEETRVTHATYVIVGAVVVVILMFWLMVCVWRLVVGRRKRIAFHDVKDYSITSWDTQLSDDSDVFFLIKESDGGATLVKEDKTLVKSDIYYF